MPLAGAIKYVDDGKTLEFYPGNQTTTCYAVFRISSKKLTHVKKWVYKGENKYQNLVIGILGKYITMKDLVMEGFNARRVMISFCSFSSEFDIFNARIQGSIMGPHTRITAMDTVFNGSAIVDSARGKLAMLQQAYVPC